MNYPSYLSVVCIIGIITGLILFFQKQNKVESVITDLNLWNHTLKLAETNIYELRVYNSFIKIKIISHQKELTLTPDLIKKCEAISIATNFKFVIHKGSFYSPKSLRKV